MGRKRSLPLAAALVCVAVASAGGAEGPSLVERRDAKLRSEFLTKAPWVTHYGKARYESRMTRKPIFAYFTRSYADCYWCERVEKGAFTDPAFPELASDAVLYCHVTSMVEGDPYPNLREEKGRGDTFPHIAVLDNRGRVLAVHQANRTVEEFRKTLQKAREFLALEGKARAGSLEDRVGFLAAVIENSDEPWAARLAGRLPDLPANLQARLHLARMRVANRLLQHADALAEGEKALELAHDDPDALTGCATAAFYLPDEPRAFRFAERAVRAKPDDVFLNWLIAKVTCRRFIGPVAVSAIEAGLKADAEGKFFADFQKGLSARGAQSYEAGAPSVVGGMVMTPYVATGRPSSPPPVRERWCAVFRGKDGALDHAMAHYEYPDAKEGAPAHRLFLLSLDRDAVVVRQSDAAWSADDLLALAAKAEPAVPHALAARRHYGDGLRPLESDSVRAGLALDPENVTLQAMHGALVATGWDAYEASEPEDVGGLRVRTYRPTGQKVDERLARRSSVVIVRDAEEKKIVRHYAAWIQPGRPTSYRIELREGAGKIAVCRAAQAWKDEEVAAIVRRAESALPDLKGAQELIAGAPAGSEGMPGLIEAVGRCEAALRKEPEFVEAAQELVRCYLFISDRVPGTELEAAAYERGMGALEYLMKRDPMNSVAWLAFGVFSYRFKLYPTAVFCLERIKDEPAFKERSLEILGTLEATGQRQYRMLARAAVKDFMLVGYTRVAPADAAPPDGLRIVESCFSGFKEGSYRFHFLYREQKLGDAVERDLVFARLHRHTVVRTFDARPTEEELSAEVRKVIEALKPE